MIVKAFFLLIFIKSIVGEATELACPACSEFDFAEKALHKMMRTEINVNQMKTDIAKKLADFRDILAGYKMTLNSFREQYEIMTQRIDEELKRKTAELQLLSEKIDFPVIAFNAYEPASTHLTTNPVIRFITAPLNSGEGYNTSTGYFTAPVGGLYQFSSHICTQLGDYISFAIVVQDKVTAQEQKLAVSYDDSDLSCTSVSAVTKLKAGDKVYLDCIYAYGSYQLQEDNQRRSSFIGMLLRKAFGKK